MVHKKPTDLIELAQDWERKLAKCEAQKADLLAALTGLVRDILYGLGPLPKTVPEWHQWEPIIQARAAIERAS